MAMANSSTFTAMKVMIKCMEVMEPAMSSYGEEKETIPSLEVISQGRDRYLTAMKETTSYILEQPWMAQETIK